MSSEHCADTSNSSSDERTGSREDSVLGNSNLLNYVLDLLLSGHFVVGINVLFEG